MNDASTEHWEQGPDVFRVRTSEGGFAESAFVPTARPEHSCSPPKPAPIQFVTARQLDGGTSTG